MESYGSDDSRLPMSGMAQYTPGMEMSGGSLGIGLSIAVGKCLGLKRKGSSNTVYTLFSDGELDEGSVWEAIMSAAHHKLDNLIAVNSALQVDLTGQVCADSMGHRIFSGIGGQMDFLRGAALSRGGKPILAFPSTAKGGAVSRIVWELTSRRVLTLEDVSAIKIADHAAISAAGMALCRRIRAVTPARATRRWNGRNRARKEADREPVRTPSTKARVALS